MLIKPDVLKDLALISRHNPTYVAWLTELRKKKLEDLEMTNSDVIRGQSQMLGELLRAFEGADKSQSG